MKKYTVLHIGPKPPKGYGIVTYIEGLISSNFSKKYNIIFLNTKSYSFIHKRKYIRIFMTLFYAILAIFICLKDGPIIAHIHTSSGTSFWEKSLLGYICKIFGMRIIIHIHSGMFDQFCRKGHNRYFISKILTMADKVIVVYKKGFKILQNLISIEKLEIIPNGIDTMKFRTILIEKKENNVIDILFAGTIHKDKGLYDILTSTRNLIDSGYKNIQINLLGGEGKEGELLLIRRECEQLKLNNWVKFHGPVFGDQKIKIFCMSDIFILPSHHESFGIANLEAMAAGLPVISTNIGAIPEYLVHGENGYLITPGDSDQLTDYLKVLINNSSLRYRMGAVNRIKVKEKYDWSIISRKIDNLYQSLIKKNLQDT